MPPKISKISKVLKVFKPDESYTVFDRPEVIVFEKVDKGQNVE
jgi:hypothetical protein